MVEYFEQNQVRKRLIFNSLFIMAYEQMLYGWRDSIICLLSTFEIANGEVIEDEKTKRLFMHSNQIFNWLEKHNLMTKEQRETLDRIRNRRNQLVHECSLMFRDIPDEDKVYLQQLIEIRKEVNKNWFVEIEIPIRTPEENAIFLNEKREFVPPTEVYDVADIYFNTLKEIALAD